MINPQLVRIAIREFQAAFDRVPERIKDHERTKAGYPGQLCCRRQITSHQPLLLRPPRKWWQPVALRPQTPVTPCPALVMPLPVA
jgi:hypothetical protein